MACVIICCSFRDTDSENVYSSWNRHWRVNVIIPIPLDCLHGSWIIGLERTCYAHQFIFFVYIFCLFRVGLICAIYTVRTLAIGFTFDREFETSFCIVIRQMAQIVVSYDVSYQ